MMEAGRYTACVVMPDPLAEFSWLSEANLRKGRIDGQACATGLLGTEGETVLRVDN